MSNSEVLYPDLRLKHLRVTYENAASNRGDMKIVVHSQDRDLLADAEKNGLDVDWDYRTITIYPTNQAGIAEATYESLLETARAHLVDHRVGENT